MNTYKIAKQAHDDCVDQGTQMFINAVNETRAWRHLRRDHAAMHQLLNDIVNFNSFEHDTCILTDQAMDGARTFRTNMTNETKKHKMSGVLKGLIRAFSPP
jgi:hypothetical protein